MASLILVPLVVVSVLVLLGADPPAVFLVGLSLYALVAALVVAFVVVLFAGRWAQGRPAGSKSSTPSRMPLG